MKVSCGNNPVKTTSVQIAPPHGQVVWNEPLDFECNTADTALTIEVWDQDALSDDLIGYVEIDVETFYEPAGTFNSAPRIKNFMVFGLNYQGKPAGKIWMSFIMSHHDEVLPEHVFNEESGGLIPKQQDMSSDRAPLMTR